MRGQNIVLINKEKRTQLADLAIPVNHGLKIKENETLIKYLDLTREQKILDIDLKIHEVCGWHTRRKSDARSRITGNTHVS